MASTSTTPHFTPLPRQYSQTITSESLIWKDPCRWHATMSSVRALALSKWVGKYVTDIKRIEHLNRSIVQPELPYCSTVRCWEAPRGIQISISDNTRCPHFLTTTRSSHLSRPILTPSPWT